MNNKKLVAYISPAKPQKRAFCIALQKNGKVARVEGDSPAEFKSALKNTDIAWANFVLDDIGRDGESIATSMGFSQGMVKTLLAAKHSKYSNYEDRDSELGIKVPAISTLNLKIYIHPLIILMRKGLILTIHDKVITRLVKLSRYGDTIMKKIKGNIPWQDKLTILLYRIMDKNDASNFEHLSEIEGDADNLVKDLMNPETPREKLGPEIYKMKHALIVYLDSLWATFDVIKTLRYGDAEVLTNDPKLLERVSALANDVTNQISLSEHMSEVLASGLEVLQSIYNNQLQILNNRLASVGAWLAIIGTAVLVPNTLATVFGIPAISEHFDWQLTFALLIASTVVSALFAYWFVRARGLIPKKLD